MRISSFHVPGSERESGFQGTKVSSREEEKTKNDDWNKLCSWRAKTSVECSRVCGLGCYGKIWTDCEYVVVVVCRQLFIGEAKLLEAAEKTFCN